MCHSQSRAQDGAEEDFDAGSDISPHTMEDDGEDEDNDSEEDEAVGQENALKLGESNLQTWQKWTSEHDYAIAGW